MSKKSAKSKNLGRILRLTQLSVLVALLLIFAFTPLGYLKVGFVEVTLNVIPVAIAATVLGPSAGAICGLVFGLTSFWQCFAAPTFFSNLCINASPVFTCIMCIVPRVLEGWLTGLIFKAISKKTTKNSLPCAISSLCCPILNTVLFIGTFLLLFIKTNAYTELYGVLGSTNIVSFLVSFIGFNGVVEAIICLIVASAVSKALLTANKKLLKI